MSDAEVVLRLNAPADLFRAAEGDLFTENGRLVSGMEELVQELLPRRLRSGGRVVVVLPVDQVRADTRDYLWRAVQRYCRLRLRQVDLALRSMRREVIGTFELGVALFLVGVGLSYYFSLPTAGTELQVLLGSGAFLVIAWVGLWYPLDMLVFARRPLVRERRVVRAILAMDLTVRADDGGARPT